MPHHTSLDLSWFRSDAYAWQDSASCAGVDPDLFQPDALTGVSRPAVARQVCAACPVWRECRLMGLPEEYGIWGGLSPIERISVRANSGLTARFAGTHDQLEVLRDRVTKALAQHKGDVAAAYAALGLPEEFAADFAVRKIARLIDEREEGDAA